MSGDETGANLQPRPLLHSLLVFSVADATLLTGPEVEGVQQALFSGSVTTTIDTEFFCGRWARSGFCPSYAINE